ncbi:hypothetical protein ACLOJK_008494 [Asimina triloba]
MVKALEEVRGMSKSRTLAEKDFVVETRRQARIDNDDNGSQKARSRSLQLIPHRRGDWKMAKRRREIDAPQQREKKDSRRRSTLTRQREDKGLPLRMP